MPSFPSVSEQMAVLTRGVVDLHVRTELVSPTSVPFNVYVLWIFAYWLFAFVMLPLASYVNDAVSTGTRYPDALFG